jgi:NMD protein affecting ribosome stability and mRNA decay
MMDVCWRCGKAIGGLPYKTGTKISHDVCEECFRKYSFADTGEPGQVLITRRCPVCNDESHPHGGPDCPRCGKC